MRRTRHLSLSALAASMLAGCSAETDKFPPACPALALLRDAADLTRFKGGSRDLSDLEIDARMLAVPASCRRDDVSHVRATLHVAIEADRGPAAATRAIALPYFIAVTRDGQVLDEQDYTLTAAFPTNVEKSYPAGEDIDLVLPVTKAKSAAAYKIYVGFRLSPAELALNRERGAR